MSVQLIDFMQIWGNTINSFGWLSMPLICAIFVKGFFKDVVIMTWNTRGLKAEGTAVLHVCLFYYTVTYFVSIIALSIFLNVFSSCILVSSGIITAIWLIITGKIANIQVAIFAKIEVDDGTHLFVSVLATVLSLLIFAFSNFEISFFTVGLLLGKFLWFDTRISKDSFRKLKQFCGSSISRCEFVRKYEEQISVTLNYGLVIIFCGILKFFIRSEMMLEQLLSLLAVIWALLVASFIKMLIIDKMIDKVNKIN